MLLKLTLDCDPDAAWRALQSPTAFREVALPWLDFRSQEPGGFPTRWGAEHRVQVKALGAFTVGTQAIRLDTLRSTDPREAGTRILRDSGGGTGGMLAAILLEQARSRTWSCLPRCAAGDSPRLTCPRT